MSDDSKEADGASGSALTSERKPKLRGAFAVGLGIFLSRIAGLVRERIFAHYLGNGDAADAFKAALRIPNFLQNLLGEGVLSASFIPVYAGLRSQNEAEKARQLGHAIGSLLLVFVSVVVLLGMYFSEVFVDVLVPGFTGEKHELAKTLVEIFFPASGILVWSAWCLAVLNSHRLFFLSYVSPVLWNVAIIVSLITAPQGSDRQIALWAGFGVFVGSCLQFLVQLPKVLSLLSGFRMRVTSLTSEVFVVLRNFVPVVMGRGVVQVSAFIDSCIASLLASGSVATLAYAQAMYLLPVGLFGMSISVAQLPELSSVAQREGALEKIREQLLSSGRQMAFWIVPCILAFFCFGDVMASILYQSGRFTRQDSVAVWITVAASSIGLFASTQSRLYSSAFYALQDTKTPLRFALVRVTASTVGALAFALYVPSLLGLPANLSVAGLSLGSGLAAWIEWALLRRALLSRVGDVRLSSLYIGTLVVASFIAASACMMLKIYWAHLGYALWMSVVLLSVFAALYVLSTWIVKIPESRQLLRRLG